MAGIATLIEEMVLFRTRNGSIPSFMWKLKMVLYRTIYFLVKGSIGQVWNPRVLYRTQRNHLGVPNIEPFKVLHRTFFLRVYTSLCTCKKTVSV